MWQIGGEKETCGTKGGLVSEWKQSMKLVVTTNGKNVARQSKIAFGHSTIVVANIMGRTEL